jgi:C1A family cysteine protease
MKLLRSGWIPTKFDSRDFVFSADNINKKTDLIILDHHFEPRNQGWGEKNVPCCVSCSIAAAMETLDAINQDSTELSELFHYYVARPVKNRLSGIDFRKGLSVVVNKGISPRKYHEKPKSRDVPMVREDAIDEPKPKAYNAAKNFRIPYDPIRRTLQYRSIPKTNVIFHWKAAIQKNIPIIFGFWMTTAYTEITPQKPVHGAIEGTHSELGHAALVLGYDDKINSFYVKDSRGASFGDQGCWWLRYDQLETDLIQESWIIEKITN